MKLISFAVKNYRSITQTSKLPLTASATVLIGPNNEGKSNLIGALAVAMTAIRSLGLGATTRLSPRLLWRTREGGVRYRWAQDFPVGLQETHPKGESQFDLEFQLNDLDIAEFKQDVKSDLNGTLPIRLLIGSDSFTFRVTKKGPGAAKLSKKSTAIARYLGKRIDFRHIRAIRTANEARGVVDSLVRRELTVLEADDTYRAAVKQIADLQAPILRSLSKSVRDTLKAFLPTVTSVDIRVPQQERFRALTENSEIIVDDGVPTHLEHKGDGVQSLAALSLMRYASQAGAGSRQLILAIEEPESHLHPKAIHQLRLVLADIAKQHQTILTTHCPLFVDRGEPGANIIVTDSKARQAEDVAEIRDVLGMRVADNLIHAELILVVEGETDRAILGAWLPTQSAKIASAILNNYLIIDPLVGARRLSHKLVAARDAMCATYCFLDNDSAGRDAIKAAQQDGLLSASEVTLASRVGMKESELEDLIDPTIYLAKVLTTYGVDLTVPAFGQMKPKWSERVQSVFLTQGKIWDEATCSSIKANIVNQVVSDPSSAVPTHCRPALDALVKALERRVR